MRIENTNTARIGARYVPAGAVEQRDNEARTVVYLFNNPQGKPAALGYAGTAGKPAFRFRFASEQARDAYVTEWVRKQFAIVTRRAEAKAERAAATHGLAVGDVVYTCWGYEQTNVDFYQVVDVRTAKTVHVRQLRQNTTETGFMCGHTVPLANEFKDDKVFRCRAMAEQVLCLTAGRSARWWDGRPVSCSWYA